MHCYERPTVRVALEVPYERGAGDWEWGPCPVVQPIEEYAYSGQEICRVLRTYGALVAEQASRADPQPFPRVRCVVRGLYTGRVLATHEWVQTAPGQFRPDGDPLLTLPPMHTWPDAVVRGWAQLNGQPGGGPCATCPDRRP